MSVRHWVSSPDGRLIAEFIWNGDRFCHQICLDRLVVGTSIEGDCHQSWPASPPVQQLSLEVINGVSMVLGVGGAGRGHWSISASPCRHQPGAIRFDLACRCKVVAEFLGSSYRITSPLTLSVIDGQLKKEGDVAIVTAADSGGPTRQWSYVVAAASQVA